VGTGHDVARCCKLVEAGRVKGFGIGLEGSLLEHAIGGVQFVSDGDEGPTGNGADGRITLRPAHSAGMRATATREAMAMVNCVWIEAPALIEERLILRTVAAIFHPKWM